MRVAREEHLDRTWERESVNEREYREGTSPSSLEMEF
jgi:hypothetical protein